MFHKSGRGDVAATFGILKIIAETNVGIMNTLRQDPVSKARRGLYEAVCLLMPRPLQQGTKQISAVLDLPGTRLIAEPIIARVPGAGVVISLVDRQGNTYDVLPS